MPSVNPGTIVTKTDVGDVSAHPKWLRNTGIETLSGNVQLPSGHRRLVYLKNSTSEYVKEDYYVNPQSLGATDAQWRVVIYRSDGAYVKSTGLGDLPTIGTPQVRIGVNAPSKAVVKFPATRTPAVKWSDGQSALIERGMEMTVEFKDTDTGMMQMVFRGMIYQVESGEAITVTAYDRLMDLVQYSDQYQSHAGYDQEAESQSRTISGGNYIYTMANNIGTLLTAQAVDKIEINPLSQMGHGDIYHSSYNFYAIPMPKITSGGVDYSPEQGRKINKVKFSMSAFLGGTRTSTSAPTTVIFNLHARINLYKKVGGTFEQKGTLPGGIYRTLTCKLERNTVGTDTDSNSATFESTVYLWTIEGDPSDYYLGVQTYTEITDTTGWLMLYNNGYVDYTASKITFAGDFYTSNDGSNWSVGSGDHPEVGVIFEHADASVNTSLFSISGNILTIAESNVPMGPSDTYLSTVDKGIAMIISYFITGAAGIQGIVIDLLNWAGLTPDVINDDMGSTTYYTSSTYDYMTCLQELVRSGGYGMMASINEPGKVIVRKRHNISEAAVKQITTDPTEVTYDQIVLRHQLTRHWAAEKATQAYIAENATSSGLPIALETDDALMNDSLANAMQSPLRSIIADNTLGTHDLLANAAGGKVVALHTNVIEGTMVLAGYRLSLWDFSTSNVGGQPVDIRIPEYNANGNVVPTEIVLGDGVTQVSLDNIRTPDRNEVANAMGLSADAISNNAASIPSTVYIFVRYSNYVIDTWGLALGNISDVNLIDTANNVITQSNATYIKTVKDAAGYTHVVAVFPASDQPGGYATTNPIDRIFFTMDGSTEMQLLDNPKYAYGGQSVHVDIRFKSA